MKKTTIILLLIANVLFWWGVIGLVGPYEFEALTHNENVVFFCCIMVAGLFLVVSAMQSYAYAIAAKERDRAQNIVNVYRERYDELSNLYKKTELNLQSCKYQLDKLKGLQSIDLIKIEELKSKQSVLRGQLTKKKNELGRFKELNKKHIDELNQSNIRFSILESEKRKLEKSIDVTRLKYQVIYEKYQESKKIQNKKLTTPFFYYIEKEDNKLFSEFIHWFNNESNQLFTSNNRYYAYDGSCIYNGYDFGDDLTSFENNPQQITLEFWDKYIRNSVQ